MYFILCYINVPFLIHLGAYANDAPVLNTLFIPRNLAIGDITEIICTIKRGTLPVEFTWMHNGQEINSHPKYKITNSNRNSIFLIGAIQASDIGNFTCIVKNAYGSDSKTESLLMDGKIKI